MKIYLNKISQNNEQKWYEIIYKDRQGFKILGAGILLIKMFTSLAKYCEGNRKL